jgi:ribosomal protein S18 acetylase RimI-like enzyme
MKKIDVEIHNKEITRKGIDAIIEFYHALATDEKKFSQATAFATGMNSPFLNVLFDNRLDRTNSAELVNSVNIFFEKHKVPWGWFIIPASSENDLVQQGFTLIEEAPAMYFNLLNQLPNMKSDFITIEETEKNDNLKSWIQPINEGFQANEEDDSYRKLNADILSKGEQRLRYFVAYYKDELAAAGTLFLSDDAVMIHNVATKKDFKNCGLGTTLTLHMMNIAKELDFKHCYLDASEEAFNLYKKIGFKVYCTTLIYGKS